MNKQTLYFYHLNDIIQLRWRTEGGEKLGPLLTLELKGIILLKNKTLRGKHADQELASSWELFALVWGEYFSVTVVGVGGGRDCIMLRRIKEGEERRCEAPLITSAPHIKKKKRSLSSCESRLLRRMAVLSLSLAGKRCLGQILM